MFREAYAGGQAMTPGEIVTSKTVPGLFEESQVPPCYVEEPEPCDPCTVNCPFLKPCVASHQQVHRTEWRGGPPLAPQGAPVPVLFGGKAQPLLGGKPSQAIEKDNSRTTSVYGGVSNLSAPTGPEDDDVPF